MLGARQSKAFLGPYAVRGGPPVQIRGAPPEYTVQIVNADPLYAHALQKKPGMEDLVKELGEERTCPWDGMILVTTPAGVAIASITGHASAAAIAAGGIPVGVGMNVVCEVLGASALIDLHSSLPEDWGPTLELAEAVKVVKTAACRRGGKKGGKEGGKSG